MSQNLDLSATLQLIDEVSAPLRSMQSQLDRASDGFADTRGALRDLQRQQANISSFQRLSGQLDTTSRNLDNARQNVESLRTQLNATSNPTQALINRFNRAENAAERLQRRFSDQTHSLQQIRTRLSNAGVSTNNLADAQQRLARQAQQANQSLNQQGERLERLRRIQSQSQKIEEVRNKSAMLAASGAAATYAAAQFIQPGLNLEQAMSKVQAVTRLDGDSAQLKTLKDQALKLGSTTSFTAADAARGQAFLAMAGFTPDSIKKALPSVLDLATAGDMELPEVADIASNIMSGMKMDDMSKVGDVLSAAFTRANLDISMLGETMKYAAPGAEGLNVSLEELAAMSGKLGDAGIQGSEGGTALRSILSNLASATPAGKKALESLGIATADAHGNLLPMSDILTELHKKTKDLGNTKVNEIFKDIAGQEASNSLKILVDQAGSGELQTLTDTLKASDGELKNLSKTMSNNTLGDFKSLTSALDGMRTSVFDSNKDNIRAFIQAITELTQKFTVFANEHPKLITSLGTVFAVLAVGAVIIGGIGAVMLTVLGPLAMLRSSLVTLGLPATLSPLALLSRAFAVVTTAVRALAMAALANPILALVAVLAIAAIYIWANWSTLGPKFQEFYSCMIAVVSGWIESTVNAWNSLVQRLMAFANQLWSGLVIRFNTGIQSLKAIILAFHPVSLFIRLFTAVWSYFSGLGAKFRQYGSNMLEGLKNGILGKAQSVISAITSIATRIKSAFTSARAMDINSPSRVFGKYGMWIIKGLTGGLLAEDSPINTILSISDSMRGAMDTSSIRFDNRKPISASIAQGQGYGSQGMAQAQPITINIYAQPHQDEQQIAKLVANEIAKQQPNNNNALYDLAEAW